MMTLAEMGAYLLERHTRDLTRIETMPRYDAASDGDRYRRWLAGGPVDPADFTGYLDTLRTSTAAGRHWRKVHIITGEPSDHERFECETWVHTTAAGEEVRILQVPGRSRMARNVGDFWVVDDEHVVRTHYDTHGRHEAAEAVHGSEARALIALRDLIWNQATPFDSWWSSHPEHHRAATEVT